MTSPKLSEYLVGKGWGLFKQGGTWFFRDPLGKIIASAPSMEVALWAAISARSQG